MAVRSIESGPAKGTRAGRNGKFKPREKKRLETRARIYEAAMDEFREVGFQSASIDRIVERVGVARGTFYFHFATKEHVLVECQRHQEADIILRLRAMGPPPESVTEYLKRIVTCLLSSQEEDDDLSKEIMAMYVRAPTSINVSEEPLIVEVLDYFIDAAERGAIRGDIAPEILTVRFLGSFFHLFMGNTLRDIDSDEAQESLDVAIDIFTNGIHA
jgi:TetR/AcrR family transcriptional repressor of uid operon